MLRNAIVMATSKTNSVIGHVVYTESRVPVLKTGDFGSICITLDAPVPRIVKDETVEITELCLSKAVIGRAVHMKYSGLDIFLKAKATKARDMIKELNKKLILLNEPVKDPDVAAADVVNKYWSKIFAFSNLTITPVAYVAGEELGGGIVAQKDGYRYDVTDIEITDAGLLAAINPLNDDMLTALGL